MPVPDFSPGEVLTAAAMDSIGLWLVKTQTVGAGVASVPVASAFSADFDNYRIIFSGGVSSAVQAITMQMTGSAAGYYGNLFGAAYNSNTPQANQINNQASWIFAGVGSTINNHVSMDVFNPFLTKVTTINGSYVPTATNGFAGAVMGYHDSAVSYTGFTLAVSGTMTGGIIRVYGYRN